MPNEGNGRHLPPSAARLGAAARAGLFPRSPLLPLGAALAAFAAVLAIGGEAAGSALLGLVTRGLDDALRARPDPVDALARALGDGAAVAAPFLLVPAAAALAAALAPALAARRHGPGSTAAPLPEEPRPGAGRAVLAAAAAAVAILALIQGLAAAWRALAGWQAGGPLPPVAGPIAGALGAAGAALLVAGLTDLALQRARLLEALALTRSEAAREEGGGAAVRRGRAQLAAEARRGASR